MNVGTSGGEAVNRETRPGPRPGRVTAICIAVLLLLFCALLWRCPYGFDWSDESYQVVLPYRFVLGDRPVADTWEVHQFSGLIALPFLRLFLLGSGGSMDGSLLYFRYVALAFQFAVSLYAFLVLGKKYGAVPAVLAASLLLLFAHYGMNNFFYNPLSLLNLVLSALFLFHGEDRGGNRLLFLLGGVAYALSVMAQPYLVLAVPVYLVYFAGKARRERRGGDAHAFREPLWFLLGIGGTAAAVVGCLLLNCPAETLWGNLSGMLGDPDHASTGVLLLLAQYLNAVRVLFGPASYLAAAAFAYGAFVRLYRFPKSEQRGAFQRAGLWLCLGTLLIAILWMIPYDYPGFHKINLAAMAAGLIAPALYLCNDCRRDRWSMLLFFLGCALSVAVQIGSNTRVRASTGMMLPASMGAVLYLFAAGKRLFGGTRWEKRFPASAACVCAALSLLIGGLRMSAMYRDEPLPALTATITQGPARGLRTTRQSVDKYDAICAAIRQYAPGEGNILITNLLPFGYLLTDLSPATPSTFNMTFDTRWLWMYYEKHPERMPDYIFCVNEAYGVSNDLSLQGAEIFAADPAYTQIDLPEGTVFLRKAA